jgi:hypothetical protein
MPELFEPNIPSEDPRPVCPFQTIEQASKSILQRVNELFWKPNLTHKNTIWWVPWSEFVQFLREYKLHMDPQEVLTPMRFIKYEPIINFALYGVPADQHQDQMSSLACHMCLNFFLEHQSRLQIEDDSPEEVKKQDHFYANAMLIFQTYDAILITGAENCRSLEDWTRSKASMKQTAIRIAMMGGWPQEVFTNFKKSQYQKDSLKWKYALSIMPELASNDFIWRIARIIQNSMQVIWWYGYCPALKDGTLEEAFDIFYEIYTTMLLHRLFPLK